MKAHSLSPNSVRTLVSQAQHPIDLDSDFDVTFKVRGGEVHAYSRNTTSEAKPCAECVRYSELLNRRERESFPNVTENE